MPGDIQIGDVVVSRINHTDAYTLRTVVTKADDGEPIYGEASGHMDRTAAIRAAYDQIGSHPARVWLFDGKDVSDTSYSLAPKP